MHHERTTAPLLLAPGRAPTLARRLRLVAGLLACAALTGASALAWSQDEEVKKDIGAEQILGLLDVNKIALTVLIFGTAWILSHLTVAALDKIGDQVATRRLLIKKITSLVRFGIYMAGAFVVIFGVIDPAPSTLLALATALGVVIGLSLQDLIKSIFAGIIILIDAPFQVGDRVKFGDAYGEVTEIGLRVVRITDLDDNVVSIPNGKFLDDVVSSGNAGALDMMIVVDFHIGIDEPYELAKRLVYEAAITSRYTFLEKPVVVHVKDVSMATSFATLLRAKLYVIDVRYEVAIATDITERVKRAFVQHGIRSPYHFERVSLHAAALPAAEPRPTLNATIAEDTEPTPPPAENGGG